MEKLRVIGTIRTPYKEKAGMPIQPRFSKSKGHIEMDRKYVDGLANLEEFSHIILVYLFHKSKGFKLRVTPFLDNEPKGLFSTRAPMRPNPIGISTVKLDSIKDNIIRISNVDILDNTPLLDIKPYVPEFDNHKAKSGWVKVRKDQMSDNRFG